MTARQIQMEVAAKHGISRDSMMRSSNVAPIVAARNEAMFRCRTELAMTFPAIARIFGKHHTSVIHGVRSHQATHGIPTDVRPERLEVALVRQAHLIQQQAHQIETLTAELTQLRVFAARTIGQGELFALPRPLPCEVKQ
jgi:hypothetical protein